MRFLYNVYEWNFLKRFLDSIVGREVGYAVICVRMYSRGKVSNVMNFVLSRKVSIQIVNTHTLASAGLSASSSSDEVESEDNVGLTMMASSSLSVFSEFSAV